MNPTVIVLGGPNGAGKTTLARQLMLTRLPDSFEFLNADLIAEGLSPFRPERAAVRAGRFFVQRFEEKVANRESFVVESTLSGLALGRRLKSAQEIGYCVELIYLWLPDAEFAKQRVEERVRQGGHRIPKDVIERRYRKSLSNFSSTYQSLADEWGLLDGSSTPPVEVAGGRKGESIEILDTERYRFLGDLISDGGDAVMESEQDYGKPSHVYIDDLSEVLEKVGAFLEERKR
ncbi:zeta toxin family protein [Pelagicoccus sp. SDUM812002]|uniref:zeta toxin family protein n=1 Tax=Pelagicoccus sp. SDUM812002 TaxID=3041266 RepID=UPI00280E6677|nr:zeta toxin family protein [Pelagicoccus sp. SDUM812002]MDQ8186953.1 zeta toxin family protein [Pelagicoccus sp. SDUM812002]